MRLDHRVTTWDEIRRRRNALLQESDWTQIADVTMTAELREAWRTYRQALRDLTETYATPAAVAWPRRPVQA